MILQKAGMLLPSVTYRISSSTVHPNVAHHTRQGRRFSESRMSLTAEWTLPISSSREWRRRLRTN